MITDHVQVRHKRGCRIVTCDPATKTIEGKIQRGEIVPINAYSYTGNFRWPKVGENWVIEEKNGSWFLDSIWEEQEPDEEVGNIEPGDTVISASSGRILKNVNGVVSPLLPKESKELVLVAEFPLEVNKLYEPSETKNTVVIFVAREENSGPYKIIVDGEQIGTGSVAVTFFSMTFLVPAGLEFEIRAPEYIKKTFASYTFFAAFG